MKSDYNPTAGNLEKRLPAGPGLLYHAQGCDLMNVKNILVYFITGGVVTTLIVMLEESGLRIWSGLATLMPIFTLISYFFIGHSRGGSALGQHAWFVLVGTLVAWVPYMATVALLSPHMPSNKAIAIGLGVFFFLATVYLLVVSKFHLFQ
jgi:uncharacterized membrane protein (GlpM family)